MLSKILYKQEHEMFREISKEKNIFRKLVMAMKLEAITAAFAESIHNAE